MCKVYSNMAWKPMWHRRIKSYILLKCQQPKREKQWRSWGTVLQAGRSRVRVTMSFFLGRIRPFVSWPWNLLGLWHKWVPGDLSWVKARPAHKADNLTAICGRLSTQCWILDISQPYRNIWPVTVVALLFIYNISTSQETPVASTAIYGDILFICKWCSTSQETNLWPAQPVMWIALLFYK
jgi:hypothetical protein